MISYCNVRLAALIFAALLIGGLTSCGGGSGGGGGSTPPANGATPGNYMLQSGSVSDIQVATVSASGSLAAPVDSGGRAINIGGYPSYGADPSRKFFYSLDPSFTILRSFMILGPGLQLQETTVSPFFVAPSLGGLESLAIDPAGKFLYVVGDESAIQSFSIDSTTGALAAASMVTEASTPDFRAVVMTPSGKFLYVNDLSFGRIFAYAIGSQGTLSAVAGSPFTLPDGEQPTRIVLDSSGKYLYAPLYIGNGIAAFSIDASTGSLVSIPGSPFTTSETPDGVAAAGSFLYAVNYPDGPVDGFRVDPDTGALAIVPGSPFPTSQFTGFATADATGQFFYVSDYTNSTIYGFTIDSGTGSLTAVAGSPFPSVAQPVLLGPLKIP